MTVSRNNMPLSSFDPRYKELILRGAMEEIEIPCKSQRAAHRLQGILCTFRARVRKHFGSDTIEARSQWEPLYGATIGKSDDGMSVRIRPKASELDMLVSGDVRTVEGDAVTVIETPSLTHDPLSQFDPELKDLS